MVRQAGIRAFVVRQTGVMGSIRHLPNWRQLKILKGMVKLTAETGGKKWHLFGRSRGGKL